jgi:hypothetical protein
MVTIEVKMQELSPALQQEVVDFIDFLKAKYRIKPPQKLTFSWAGCLRDYKDQFTGIQLQKEVLKWG